jgi:hypothetical protein
MAMRDLQVVALRTAFARLPPLRLVDRNSISVTGKKNSVYRVANLRHGTVTTNRENSGNFLLPPISDKRGESIYRPQTKMADGLLPIVLGTAIL